MSFDGDEAGWNRAHAAARQGQPWGTVWSDFTAARQMLLAVLKGMDDDSLPGRHPAAGATTIGPTGGSGCA